MTSVPGFKGGRIGKGKMADSTKTKIFNIVLCAESEDTGDNFKFGFFSVLKEAVDTLVKINEATNNMNAYPE